MGRRGRRVHPRMSQPEPDLLGAYAAALIALAALLPQGGDLGDCAVALLAACLAAAAVKS
jgi:ABC-type branched-subunit amino acid transport system permease subunit